MKLYELGREGLLDDTKPIINEESIYKKLKNNEKAMSEGKTGNKDFYDGIKKFYIENSKT